MKGKDFTCPMICHHDSHFLLLLNLLLFLLIVLHYLQPLGLHQAALLDVELLLRLQEQKQFTPWKEESSNTMLLCARSCVKTDFVELKGVEDVSL